MPKIRRAAPSRKSTRVPIGMGARVKESSRTMTVMGRTEEMASMIFSFSFFRIDSPLNRFRKSHVWEISFI